MTAAIKIKTKIDTHIRVSSEDLPADVVRTILGHLRIWNPQKDRAQRQMLYNADWLPDHIDLWRSVGDVLVLPRGYVHRYEEVLRVAGLEIEWDSSMTRVDEFPPCFWNVPPIPLRDYQTEAVEKLVQMCCGFYQAPTGAGKSRVMLEVARRCGQPTLVIMEKKDLVSQWVEAATELGFLPGVIGDGEWREANLTLATRQSIWARRDDLGPAGWFNEWGVVIIDEGHHVVSETNWDLIQCFPAYYRLACSATPQRDAETFPMVEAVIGPVIHTTTVVDAADALVIPSVKIVSTNFEFDYQPTRKEEYIHEDDGRKYTRRIQNNYAQLLDALQEDDERNGLIVRLAIEEALQDHACLVLTARKEHIKEMYHLANAICQEQEHDIPLMSLTAENSSGARAIAGVIDKSPRSILFSTLAGEGSDIPRLDRLFFSFPARKLLGYQQGVGRVMRPHPVKTDAVVFDFFDERVEVLRNQMRERRQMLYGKQGYEVEVI